MDILTRCAVRRDEVSKKTTKIVPLKEPEEPVVISLPISQAKSFIQSNSVSFAFLKISVVYTCPYSFYVICFVK